MLLEVLAVFRERAGEGPLTELGGLRVERVVMPDGARSWTVVRADGVPVAPVDRFLAYLQVLPRSPNTVASYAYDLRAFVEFLDEHGVVWTDVEVDHLARFVRWLEQPAGNVVLLHGAEPARSAATVARAVNAVHAFFGLPRHPWSLGRPASGDVQPDAEAALAQRWTAVA